MAKCVETVQQVKLCFVAALSQLFDGYFTVIHRVRSNINVSYQL